MSSDAARDAIERIIINTIPFKQLSVADALEKLRAIDCRNLELHITHFYSHPGKNQESLDAIEKYGYTIAAMAGGWCDFFTQGEAFGKVMESIQKQVDIMDSINCKNLRLFLGFLKRSEYDTIKKQLLIKNLKLLSDTYPDKTFLFETHGEISIDSDEMNDIFSKIGRANIKINFDAANIEKDGHDAYEFLVKNIDHIGHMHIKGLLSDRGKEIKDFFCAYGKGMLDYGKIFKFMIKSSYSGCLSLEFEGHGDPIKEIDYSLKMLKADINLLYA